MSVRVRVRVRVRECDHHAEGVGIRVSVSSVMQFEIPSVFHESLCHRTTLLSMFSFCTVTETRKRRVYTATATLTYLIYGPEI